MWTLNRVDSSHQEKRASLRQRIAYMWKGHEGPFTPTPCDDVAMHAFLDAMKRRDWVFTLHAIKPLFPHCQIYIFVVKLENCSMRAITVAMDLALVVTRQCEYIFKIYSVLIFPLVALLHRSLARSLCEGTFKALSHIRDALTQRCTFFLLRRIAAIECSHCMR